MSGAVMFASGYLLAAYQAGQPTTPEDCYNQSDVDDFLEDQQGISHKLSKVSEDSIQISRECCEAADELGGIAKRAIKNLDTCAASSEQCIMNLERCTNALDLCNSRQ